MTFLCKGRKEDLIELGIEFGLDVGPNNTAVEIRRLITGHSSYNEEEAKASLHRIMEERIEAEKMQREREKEERKERLLREEWEYNLKMKQLEFQNSQPSSDAETEPIRDVQSKIQLMNITPKYDAKKDEMHLYLTNFERRAEIANVPKRDWVAYLLGLLPPDIANNIAREPTEKANNYDDIKQMLLRRYKLNPEKLRQLFLMQTRHSEESWRSYAHTLNNYFTEWIEELKIEDFDQLKKLLIADQLKRRVPSEMKEHYIDEWNNMIDPFEVAEKFDEYEYLREGLKNKAVSTEKVKNPMYWHNEGYNKYKSSASNFPPQRPSYGQESKFGSHSGNRNYRNVPLRHPQARGNQISGQSHYTKNDRRKSVYEKSAVEKENGKKMKDERMENESSI